MTAASNVIDALDREWNDLLRSPRLRRALRRWAATEPDLRFDTAATLVERVERRDGDPRVTDAVLVALARRARHDELAARVLLQLILPGCKRLLSVYGRSDPDEWASFVVSVAWDRIRRYPCERRPRSVAANLVLDIRQQVVRAHRRERVTTPVHELADDEVPQVAAGPDPIAEVVGFIGAAVRSGVLDRDSARLVLLTRVAGVSVSEVARRTQTGVQTVRRRRVRAEARLRRLVAA